MKRTDDIEKVRRDIVWLESRLDAAEQAAESIDGIYDFGWDGNPLAVLTCLNNHLAKLKETD